MIQEIAPFAKDSRLFGVATAPQAIMVMAKGHELGLPLTTSFEYIHIISDKPTLSPRGALALIMQSGQCENLRIEEQNDDKGNPLSCKVTMKRKGGIEYTTIFTMQDAARADLVKAGSGWTKYPASMLKWRAIGYAADVVFPDIIGGMKRADEFGAAISPEGDVIATTWTVQPTQTPPAQTPVANSMIPTKIQQLIEAFGADVVLKACGSKMPTTEAEVHELTARLNQQLNSITVDGAATVQP
jgi:hypothetical protein